MIFLPYENLVIRTKLSTKEVLAKLDDAVEPKRYLRWFTARNKPYEGIVEGSQFSISRVILYRNSFIPIIKGKVESEIGGSSIYIKMHLHVLVMVFAVIWLGSVGSLFLAMLISFISSGVQTKTIDFSTLLAPGGMFTFGYLLILGGFKFESVKSKKFLRDLFKAEEMEELGIGNPFETAG